MGVKVPLTFEELSQTLWAGFVHAPKLWKYSFLVTLQYVLASVVLGVCAGTLFAAAAGFDVVVIEDVVANWVLGIGGRPVLTSIGIGLFCLWGLGMLYIIYALMTALYMGISDYRAKKPLTPVASFWRLPRARWWSFVRYGARVTWYLLWIVGVGLGAFWALIGQYLTWDWSKWTLLQGEPLKQELLARPAWALGAFMGIATFCMGFFLYRVVRSWYYFPAFLEQKPAKVRALFGKALEMTKSLFWFNFGVVVMVLLLGSLAQSVGELMIKLLFWAFPPLGGVAMEMPGWGLVNPVDLSLEFLWEMVIVAPVFVMIHHLLTLSFMGKKKEVDHFIAS